MTAPNKLLFQKTVNVAWGDLDALGHVNNVRYFDYFQEARVEWLATLNMDLNQPIGPVLVHTGCTYILPIFYPATLTIHCTIHSLGRSSFMIDYDLLQEGQLMAQGTSKIVWIDYQKKQSVPLPDSLRALF